MCIEDVTLTAGHIKSKNGLDTKVWDSLPSTPSQIPFVCFNLPLAWLEVMSQPGTYVGRLYSYTFDFPLLNLNSSWAMLIVKLSEYIGGEVGEMEGRTPPLCPRSAQPPCPLTPLITSLDAFPAAFACTSSAMLFDLSTSH